MSSSTAHNSSSTGELLEALKGHLWKGSLKQQLAALEHLGKLGESGYQVLMDFLLTAKEQAKPTIAAGRSLQILHQADNAKVADFLETDFSTGLLPSTVCQVDYGEVQTALIAQDFELADRLTLQKMCELAGPNAVKRKWLYFTEVNIFPDNDLRMLDQLWLIYSEGKFGFSKQREIWLGVGKDWERFWPKIAWKAGKIWTRYPGEFTWNLQAPVGHLPLTNQLRGVRVMDALMNHPAWSEQP